MVSSRLLIFQSAIFILTAQAVAWPDFLHEFTEKGNYTANSTCEANFNDLLLPLSSITKIDHGFYNSSCGQNSDQVYGIGLCRGDVKADVCSGCLNNASSLLKESCPQQKEAIVQTIRDLPELKFAAGNATAPNFQTLYALEQCTADLSEQELNDCLLEALKGTSQCCDGEEGGRVLSPSCNFGCQFYDATTAAPFKSEYGLIVKLAVELHEPEYARTPNPVLGAIGLIIVVLTVACTSLISMGIYLSVKRKSKNNGTMNVPTTELGSLPVGPGSVSSSTQLPKLMDKRNGNAPNKDKLKKVWKKLTTMFRLGKKKDEFVVTPINKENEIQELMPQPMLESDAVMPSSSTSELDEYKWRREEAEREVHIQREKISSLRKEMQEEVNSMKRQQTQQQQDMEAKQRQMEQMEQQIEFLLSQLQLRRDPPPP